MPISPADPSIFYNLQIKPDFVAGTLAELDAALGTYEDKYVLVAETNFIYYIERSAGSLTRIEAYDFSNYRHAEDAGGGGALFGETEPSNSIGDDEDTYLKIHENRWYKKISGVWVDQSTILLAVQPAFPALVGGQRGVLFRTLEFTDPTIIQPYISVGDGSYSPGSGNSISPSAFIVYYPPGEFITAGFAVKVVSNQLFLVDKDDPDADQVLGITTGTISGSGETGVQFAGLLSLSSWSWTPGSPIYLGDSGGLTQTPPTTGSITELGIALSATVINIRIQQAIYL